MGEIVLQCLVFDFEINCIYVKVIFIYVLLYKGEGFSGVFEFGAWVGFHVVA
jgi:hypothetical protein